MLIGVFLAAISKEIARKKNGFILAFVVAISTILAETVNVIYAYVGLAILIISGAIIGLISIVQIIMKKVQKDYTPRKIKFDSISERIPSKLRITLKIIAIIIPIILWSSVSINLGVMFDNNPHLLWIHAPSTVKTGNSFEVTVEAWDKYERISVNYHGTIEFFLESYNLTTYNHIGFVDAVLPSKYTFTGQLIIQGIIPAYSIKDGKDNGIHRFNVMIKTPGIHYILISDTKTQNTYYSNPIVVNNFSNTDPMIYWGDIHTHSMLSDGSGSPEHSFFYARYISCLDFYALTEHGEHLDLFGLAPKGSGLSSTLERATNKAYEPFEFVSFQGLEWTTGYITTFNINFGHYTCIFSGDKLPHISANTQKSPDALWDQLDKFTSTAGHRALALPHHTVRKSFMQDWTYINPTYVKLAEVTSVHGEGLFEPRHQLSYRGSVDMPPKYGNGSSIIDTLNMGKRLTLYASSDGHDGHPGHSLSHTDAYIGRQWPLSIWHARNDHPYPGGLTAVYANNLTRDSIFNGLENQQIYANSDHGRPILTFAINGTTVGFGSTLIAANQNEHRQIEIFLAQDGAPVALKYKAAPVHSNWVPNWLATIEIIKKGALLYSSTVLGPINKITFTDTAPIEGMSYRNSCLRKEDGQYYINEYSENPVDPNTLNTGGFDYYLVRVVGANGRTSYIGPIWVEY